MENLGDWLIFLFQFLSLSNENNLSVFSNKYCYMPINNMIISKHEKYTDSLLGTKMGLW